MLPSFVSPDWMAIASTPAGSDIPGAAAMHSIPPRITAVVRLHLWNDIINLSFA